MGAPMNDTAQTLADQIRLTVDYDQSLQQMIAARHYSWITPDIIAARIPMDGTGTVHVEAMLFHFDRFVSSEDAIKAINTEDPENPWEPAKIEHLLSFGVKHPDGQRTYPILGLGSVAEVAEDRRVPCLDGTGTGCYLDLPWWDNVWSNNFRFLAVRNLSSGA